MRIIVGISGASGSIYALAVLKLLRTLDIETHLVVSKMGTYVMQHECSVGLEELKGYADFYYEQEDLAAPISGGSFKTDGMVIVPCSMKTLACVAHGFSESLLTRAADVCLKERRKLILVTRETPLSMIHLENMLSAARAGAIVMPASPSFYHTPGDISDLIISFAGRVLDELGITHNLTKRWGENS